MGQTLCKIYAMSAVKLYLDKRVQRRDNTYPLKLMIAHQGNFLINLQVYLKEDEFIGGEIIIPDNPKRQKALTAYVKERQTIVQNMIYRLIVTGEIRKMTKNALKAYLTQTEDTDNDNNNKPVLFKERYAAYYDTLTRQSTRSLYDLTYKKVAAFTNIDTLKLEEINYGWLKDFEQFLKCQGLAINSISIYLRNIRSIYNDAIDRDIITQEHYPFRKFRIKNEKTRKRSLTVEQLRILRDYPCESAQIQYRDIFMLIFYLCGINMIDLAHLTKIEADGYIEYRRSKTGRPYRIKIEPEATEIIEKYRGNKYLINILDRYADYKNYLHRINLNLRQIGIVETGKHGKKVKQGIFPELTTYWARHTWATIAAELDIPKESIAAALGHGGNSVTDIYISLDQKKIDDANRRVIDYVNSL